MKREISASRMLAGTSRAATSDFARSVAAGGTSKNLGTVVMIGPDAKKAAGKLTNIREEQVMPIVQLQPGKSLELNSPGEVVVNNPSNESGEFSLASATIVVEHKIPPKQKYEFKIAKGELCTITNIGSVLLEVTTNGL